METLNRIKYKSNVILILMYHVLFKIVVNCLMNRAKNILEKKKEITVSEIKLL